MDVDNFPILVQYLLNSGHSLNTETCMIIHNSLILLLNDNHLKKIYFWGQILGVEEDYYIAFGYRKDILKNRIYFYSKNAIDWYLLQRPDKSKYYTSSICSSMFQGDPRFQIQVLDDSPNNLIEQKQNELHGPIEGGDFQVPRGFADSEEVTDMRAEGSEEDSTEETDDKPIQRLFELIEEDRLAAVVRSITRESAIIPRGSIFKRIDGVALPNPAFQGLSLFQTKDFRNYLHFRTPRQKWDKNLLYMNEYNYSTDFMDPIVEDVPKAGCWASQITYRQECVIMRNLVWPGMTFFHALGTPYHGFTYIGNGKKNLDLPFMIY